VLAYATAYGYAGAKGTFSTDDSTLSKVSYLGGQVVGLLYKHGGHITCGDFDCIAQVDEFMAGAPVTASPVPPPPPLPPTPQGGYSPPPPSPPPSPNGPVQGGENNSDVSDGSSSISAGMIGGIAGGISALIFGVFGGLWCCKSKHGGSPPGAAPPRSRDPRVTETERAAYELSGGKRPASESLSGGRPPVV